MLNQFLPWYAEAVDAAQQVRLTSYERVNYHLEPHPSKLTLGECGSKLTLGERYLQGFNTLLKAAARSTDLTLRR